MRLRLTVLYGALFLASSLALLGITYTLTAYDGTPRLYVLLSGTRSASDSVPERLEQAHAPVLHSSLTESAIALAILAMFSTALGWLVAGRAVRPVRMMADKARRISELNLHERLSVAGPDDELKELGDTFDGLLGRLDAAFAAQRRFVANASHELRTPLTLQRTIIEVVLADPEADSESLRSVCERVLVVGEKQERLIESMLTLASSQRGLDRRESVDIARLTADVLRDRYPGRFARLRLDSTLTPAWTLGAGALLERLVANLIDNALQHNVADGWVRVFAGIERGRPVLRVSNSGRVLPHDCMNALFQPFERLESHTDCRDGVGLGLSIVAAIATAHAAEVHAYPIASGGLNVEVRFSAAECRNARCYPVATLRKA